MQIGDVAKRLFMLFLAASVALAIFRGMPANPSDWYGWAETQLVDVKAWLADIAGNVTDWVDQQPEPENIIPDGQKDKQDAQSETKGG